MIKILIVAAVCFPSLVFAQASKEDYAIYSQCLKNYQKEKDKKMYFVVKESADYIRKYDTVEIRNIIAELRGYLSGDLASATDVKFMYRSFADTLKKDTLWMPLLEQLDKKSKSEFVLENKFSKKLQTVMIRSEDADAFFIKVKDFRKSWAAFQYHYSKRAVMVEFSEIATDGKRAVFYFVSKCGGLCGNGFIVFCYKENNHWKFIPTFPRWVS